MALNKIKVAEVLNQVNPNIKFERVGDYVHWDEESLKITAIQICETVGVILAGWTKETKNETRRKRRE